MARIMTIRENAEENLSSRRKISMGQRIGYAASGVSEVCPVSVTRDVSLNGEKRPPFGSVEAENGVTQRNLHVQIGMPASEGKSQ